VLVEGGGMRPCIGGGGELRGAVCVDTGNASHLRTSQCKGKRGGGRVDEEEKG
jgi:hypothetical protein